MNSDGSFTQVLVTRFSVRLDSRSILRGRDASWLFSDARLRRRMVLFANLTFPSIVKSSSRPEFYVIVIDKELPENYKAELESLTNRYDWVIVHEWNPRQEFRLLRWVLDVLEIESEFVLMSQIDDDDALELGFNERIRNFASRNIHKCRRGQWVWIGSRRTLEWDLVFSDSEVGFVKPNSTGMWYWQAVGTSILVPNKWSSPTSYSWTHTHIQAIFSPFWRWRGLTLRALIRQRLSLLFRLLKHGRINAVVSLMFSGWLVDLDSSEGEEVNMLMTNSGTNLQGIRFELGHQHRTRDVQSQLERFGLTTNALSRIQEEFDSKNAGGSVKTK